MKSAMQNNFDLIAPGYDLLARMVFGRSIVNAQIYPLKEVPRGAEVLIVGGGTGRILSALDDLNIPIKITYVEPSSAMLRRANKKGPFKNLSVTFMCASHDALGESESFDIIITGFFLDLFNQEQLPGVMQALKSHLHSNGLWFCTDFHVPQKLWQKVLVRIMYGFFRLVADIPGDRLLDFGRYFDLMGMRIKHEKSFYYGMIQSTVYKIKAY